MCSRQRLSDLEQELLPLLAAQGELMLFRHRGFWRSMDTYKEVVLLELWETGAPWKGWRPTGSRDRTGFIGICALRPGTAVR